MTTKKKMTANDYKLMVEKNDGKTFWDVMDQKVREDPNNEKCKHATSLGNEDAAAFMKIVRDHNHPDHEKNLKKYKDDYNMDENKVHTAFVAKMQDHLNAKPYENRNTAYENSVLSKLHTVATADDMAFNNKFKDLIRAKWNAVGYKGDYDVVIDFFNEHPMSRPITNAIKVKE